MVIILEFPTSHIQHFVIELFIFAFLLLANQNRYELFIGHLVMKDNAGNTYAPTAHIPSLMKTGHCVLYEIYAFG